MYLNKALLTRTLSRVFRHVNVSLASSRTGRALLDVAARVIGDVRVDVAGLCLSGSLQHRYHLWELQGGGYEQSTVSLFKKVIHPGMIVCDVGANIGYYAVMAGKHVGPSGKVYAFEPDPRSFMYLRKNVVGNGLAEIVSCCPVAIAETSETTVLYLNTTNPSNSTRLKEWGKGTGHKVTGSTLDDALGNIPQLDVIKVDIEGGELRALAGMRQLISRSPDVHMFIECNPSALREADSGPSELVRTLNGMGMTVWSIEKCDDELTELNPARAQLIDSTCNLYCRRSDVPGLPAKGDQKE